MGVWGKGGLLQPRRDGERDGGPRDSRWTPHRSDKDRVSTYRTLQGKTELIKQFFRIPQPLGRSDKDPDPEMGGNRGKQRPASLRRRRAAEPLPVLRTFGFRNRSVGLAVAQLPVLR